MCRGRIVSSSFECFAKFKTRGLSDWIQPFCFYLNNIYRACSRLDFMIGGKSDVAIMTLSATNKVSWKLTIYRDAAPETLRDEGGGACGDTGGSSVVVEIGCELTCSSLAVVRVLGRPVTTFTASMSILLFTLSVNKTDECILYQKVGRRVICNEATPAASGQAMEVPDMVTRAVLLAMPADTISTPGA